MKNTENMRNKRAIGDKGEAIAVKYLESHGYRIILRNYHSRYGEIDIIAELGEYIVFVEVKFRKSSLYGEPSQAVDYRKQEKLKKTALQYIADNELVDKDFRFDIIEVTATGAGAGEDTGEAALNHIENAFC